MPHLFPFISSKSTKYKSFILTRFSLNYCSSVTRNNLYIRPGSGSGWQRARELVDSWSCLRTGLIMKRLNMWLQMVWSLLDRLLTYLRNNLFYKYFSITFNLFINSLIPFLFENIVADFNFAPTFLFPVISFITSWHIFGVYTFGSGY